MIRGIAFGLQEGIAACINALGTTCRTVEFGYTQPDGTPIPPDTPDPPPGVPVRWYATATLRDGTLRCVSAVTVYHDLGLVAVLSDLIRWLGGGVTIVGLEAEDFPATTREAPNG